MTNKKPKPILIKSNIDSQEIKDLHNKPKQEKNIFLSTLGLLLTVTLGLYIFLTSINMNQFSSCCFSLIITQIIFLLFK